MQRNNKAGELRQIKLKLRRKMLSDHIEALFIKKQELIKLLESGTLEQVLKSSEVGGVAQTRVYSKIEKEIARINSELKAAYNPTTG